MLYPPLLQGTAPVKTDIESLDLDVVSGDPWEIIIDLGMDLTDAEIKNAVRRTGTHGSSGTVGPPVMEFHQEVVDAVAGQLRLFLDYKETRKLAYNAYWELQVALPGQAPKTVRKGLVRATNNEVVR